GDDVVAAYVADALGSVMAEAIVACGLDCLERYVAPEGLRITNSYSPGYCGWNVSEQHALFSLLPEGFCGVRLCESGLMLPIKSVSAVVGIGPEVERRDYGCALCRKADCYKRRLGA
ncbi:protein containing Vitamin B12 dependent methionine synthase, activation region domain protein, partial [human gut metagenome]